MNRVLEWMWIGPGVVGARLSRGLVPHLHDGRWMLRHGWGMWLPVVALVGGLAVGVTAPSSWGGPDTVLIEQAIVLFLLLVMGALSGTMALWFLVGYAIGDQFFAGIPWSGGVRPWFGEPPWVAALLRVRVPRLASYLLFAAGALGPPVLGRMFAMGPTRRWGVRAGYPAAIAVAVAGWWAWAMAYPLLIRPVFVWQGQVPDDPAVQAVQGRVPTILVLGGIALVVRLVLEHREATRSEAHERRDRIERRVSVALARGPGVVEGTWGGLVARAVLAAIALSSVITRAWEWPVLLGTVVALTMWRRGMIPIPDGLDRWLEVIRGVPTIVRAGMVAFFGFLIVRRMTTNIGDPSTFGAIYWPIVATSGIAAVLLPPPARRPTRPAMATAGATLALVAATTMLLTFQPSPAWAGNCSGLVDCFSSSNAMVAAAIGLAVFVGALTLGIAGAGALGWWAAGGYLNSISLATGRDALTGEQMTDWGRFNAYLGFLPPGLPGAFRVYGDAVGLGLRAVGGGNRTARAAGQLGHAIDVYNDVDGKQSFMQALARDALRSQRAGDTPDGWNLGATHTSQGGGASNALQGDDAGPPADSSEDNREPRRSGDDHDVPRGEHDSGGTDPSPQPVHADGRDHGGSATGTTGEKPLAPQPPPKDPPRQETGKKAPDDNGLKGGKRDEPKDKNDKVAPPPPKDPPKPWIEPEGDPAEAVPVSENWGTEGSGTGDSSSGGTGKGGSGRGDTAADSPADIPADAKWFDPDNPSADDFVVISVGRLPSGGYRIPGVVAPDGAPALTTSPPDGAAWEHVAGLDRDYHVVASPGFDVAVPLPLPTGP